MAKPMEWNRVAGYGKRWIAYSGVEAHWYQVVRRGPWVKRGIPAVWDGYLDDQAIFSDVEGAFADAKRRCAEHLSRLAETPGVQGG